MAAVSGASRRAPSIKQRKNGHTLKAARVNTPIATNGAGGRILPRGPRMAWSTLPSVAAITPQYLNTLLANAAAGSYLQQWELFDLMLDTWPVLASCVQELTYGIERKKLIFEPYREEDEQPTPSAVEKMQLVSTALTAMTPTPGADENDFEGTIRDLISAWFVGLSAVEIVWTTNELGTVPILTQWAHPKYLAFNSQAQLGLMANSGGATQWQPFPDNKFIVGIHKAKSSTPTSGALLRPLAWWWCAANFSSDWMLNLAQLFGLPWRVATYDPNLSQDVLSQLDTMLQNIGSAGWLRKPTGVELELTQPNALSSDHSPQGEMLDRADRYARDLILGQTMTGGAGTTGKGGGQAFGKVELGVKEDRIDAAGKFVANVINQQLIKSILRLNYGDDSEAPKLRFLNDEEGDLPEAQRDKVLADMGVPIGVKFMQKKYGIPEPAEGEELIEQAQPTPQFGSPAGSNFGQQEDQQTGDKADATQDGEPPQAKLQRILAIENDNEFMTALQAAASQMSLLPSEEHQRNVERGQRGDKPGHAFHGNQYTKLGDRVHTPHGEGTVVGKTNTHAFVSVKGIIHQVKHSDLKLEKGKP